MMRVKSQNGRSSWQTVQIAVAESLATEPVDSRLQSPIYRSTKPLQASLLLRDERLSQRPPRWPKCPGSESETEEKQRHNQIGGTAAGSK
jgi:hypothetical protein